MQITTTHERSHVIVGACQVGPWLAGNMVRTLGAAGIVQKLDGPDAVKYLTTVQGIGQKTAPTFKAGWDRSAHRGECTPAPAAGLPCPAQGLRACVRILGCLLVISSSEYEELVLPN